MQATVQVASKTPYLLRLLRALGSSGETRAGSTPVSRTSLSGKDLRLLSRRSFSINIG